MALDRAEKLFLVCTLTMQASAWIKHVRDEGLLEKKPNQMLKAAQLRLNDFIDYVYDESHEDDRDQTYEFSTKLSSLLEVLVQLQDEDIDLINDIVNLEAADFDRIRGLMKKITKQKSLTHESTNQL